MLETALREQAVPKAPADRPPPFPRASQTLPDPFVFVPINNAEASKGRGAAKRIVRAHVTRVQHAKSSTLSFTQNLENWTVTPHIHRTQPARTESQSQFQPPKVPSRRSSGDAPKAKRARKKPVDAEDVSTAKRKLSESKAVIPAIPAAKRDGASRQDPFWTYPVEYEPYLPAIFAHYIENVAVNIPDLDTSAHTSLLRRRWFPLAMEEASTMYAVLLMAASHYCAINPHVANLIDLLHLKSRALNEINSALRDPKRATSDAVIGAVMKMAAYEACFGDSAVFSAHMKGLGMMLTMRGGLGTLGLDGLLERMVVWIDLNAAFICGLQPLFGNEAFPTTFKLEKPDPYHFAGIQ